LLSFENGNLIAKVETTGLLTSAFLNDDSNVSIPISASILQTATAKDVYRVPIDLFTEEINSCHKPHNVTFVKRF